MQWLDRKLPIFDNVCLKEGPATLSVHETSSIVCSFRFRPMVTPELNRGPYAASLYDPYYISTACLSRDQTPGRTRPRTYYHFRQDPALWLVILPHRRDQSEAWPRFPLQLRFLITNSIAPSAYSTRITSLCCRSFKLGFNLCSVPCSSHPRPSRPSL